MLRLISPVHAADQTVKLTPDSGTAFFNLSKVTFPAIISSGIQIALVVAAIIFFIMLIIGGIRWMLSGGDKGQTEAARGQVTAALIGLVIVFAAWAIATLLGQFFGVSLFGELNLPDFIPGDAGTDSGSIDSL